MQAGESYRIVVRRGPQPNQVFELNTDTMNLGRDITNSITINDREVSRHHLRFTRTPDGYNLEDLGSTNGTFINGKRLNGMTSLKNGDMIGLGETVTLGYEAIRPGGMPAAPQAPANPYQPAQQPAAQPPAASPYQAPAPNPYQQSQQPAANPYQPPQQSQPPQPPANPYQPPQPAQSSYAPPPSPSPYGAPADAYGQPDPYAQQGYGAPDPNQGYYAQQGQYGAPPPPGYDYDPYAMRENDARSPMRTILLGCLALTVFCCCFTIIAVVLVDTFNLYCQLPLINQVFQALGLITCGAG